MSHVTHMNESCPLLEHTFDGVVCVWQYAANSTPHCNALHHTASHCTTLHNTAAPHCTTLQHTRAPAPDSLFRHRSTHTHARARPHMYQYLTVIACTAHTASACITLQHTATHCNTLQHTACITRTASHTTHLSLPGSCSGLFCVPRDTLQHIATHCSTLQHTATHCNAPHCCLVRAQGSFAKEVYPNRSRF